MVIDGNTFTRATLDVDRIRLPEGIVEQAVHARFTGNSPIDAWLLVLWPGRYRLVKKPVGAPAGDLARILELYEEFGTTGDVLDGTGDNEHPGIRGRILPCTLSPRGPGWRIHLPKEAKDIADEKTEPRFVFLMTVKGYIEIWFPSTFRKAVSVPFSRILP